MTVQELNQQEAEAQAVLARQIPRRRYGAGVTKQTQQQVLQQRSQAQQRLNQIEQERERLRQQEAVRNQPSSEQRVAIAISQALSSRRRRIPEADQLGFSLTREERSKVSQAISEAEDRAERMQGQIAVAEYKRGVQELSMQSRTFDPQELKAVAKQAIETGVIKINAQGLVTESPKSSIKGAGDNLTQAPMMTRGKGVGGSDISKAIASGIPDFGSKALTQKITSSPKYQQFKDQLSGRAFSEAQARSQGFKKGTAEFEKAVSSSQKGLELQSAVFASFVGVPKIPNKVPLRSVSLTAKGEEIQVPAIIAGQEKTLTVYSIRQERTPPLRVVTAQEGGFLFSKKVIPPKIKLTNTLKPVVNNGPVLTLTTKTGKTFRLETLRGASLKIKPEQITKLRSSEQFIFQRLAESSARRPVSTKNLPVFFKKSDDLYLGGIIKSTGGNARLPEKLISRAKTATRIRSIRDTDQFEEFKSLTFFKEIKGGASTARARGTTPSLNLRVRVYKEPLIFDDIKDVKILKPASTVRRTPLSVTFARPQVLNIPKAVTTTKTISTKVLNTKSLPKVNGISRISLGVVAGVSARSSYGSASDIGRGINAARPSAKAQETPKTNIQELGNTKDVARSIPISIPRTTSVSVSIPKQIPREIAREIPRQIPREIAREIQKQTPRQVARQLARQVPKQPSRSRSIPIPRFPSRRTSDRLPKQIRLPTLKSLGSLKVPGFRTFVIKNKKEVLLPGVRSKGAALNLGQKVALNKLRATFGVKPTNQLITGSRKANRFTLNTKAFRGFRIQKGKRIPLTDRFIQKAGQRLSSKGERQEIQRLRRMMR